MEIWDAVLSALLNLVVFAGIPLLGYCGYQAWRHRRGVVESLRRAGLQLGDARFLGVSLALAAGTAAMVALWSPPLEPFLRRGSPQRAFIGLGLSGEAVVMALLYGVIKTGLSEEVLFRGLIAGSLGRRLPLAWANVAQAVIFLLPHLFMLLVMPEMWGILPVVFMGALLAGWLRIRSGSIVGPWLIHAAANVAMCLNVAWRTAGMSA